MARYFLWIPSSVTQAFREMTLPRFSFRGSLSGVGSLFQLKASQKIGGKNIPCPMLSKLKTFRKYWFALRAR